jgi:hypothetical protein
LARGGFAARQLPPTREPRVSHAALRSVLTVGELSCQGGAGWSVVIDGHQPAVVSADHREVPWRSDLDVAANAAGQPPPHCVVLRGVEDAAKDPAKAGIRPVRGSKLEGRVGQR